MIGIVQLVLKEKSLKANTKPTNNQIMKSIFAATLLAIGIAAQREDKSGEQEIDWDNMPDRLCSSGDENCWEWQDNSGDDSGKNATDSGN